MYRLISFITFTLLSLSPLCAETLYTILREQMVLGQITYSEWYTELKMDRQKLLFEYDCFDAGSNTYVEKTYKMVDYKKIGNSESFTGHLMVNGIPDKNRILYVTLR